MILKRKIKYISNNGNKPKGSFTEFWGVYYHHNLYFNSTYGLKKVLIIGSLCFIMDDIIMGSSSPMASNMPFAQSSGTSGYTPQYDLRSSAYIFDLQDKTIYHLDSSEMKEILKKDPELLQEYSALSYRKRKQQVFLYMRKYNERHPLYLPN